MYLIKNNKLSLLSNKLSILSNKLCIISKKLIISSNKLTIISSKLCIIVQAIIVQAIIVQRYYCAPNILYYIKYSKEGFLTKSQSIVGNPRESKGNPKDS
jgi:hypothetical protein